MVVDDRRLMENWWQLSFLTSAADFVSTRPKTLPAVTEVGVIPTDIKPPPTPAGGPVPGGSFALVAIPPHTSFYEHPNMQGDQFDLDPEFAYSDLTGVSKGFLGLDDWNDKISSLWMERTKLTVLHEHVNFTGSTFTTTHHENNVGSFNDLTSSCPTWGTIPTLFG